MAEEKIRVLVVSYLPWRNDVSVGNTLSNIFDGMQDKVEFLTSILKVESRRTMWLKNIFIFQKRNWQRAF